jgi:hypothetical protein
MCKDIHSLYQSGESVTVSGVYALVDVPAREPKTVCEVRSGQFFPDYQGRAVCWFLVRTIQETNTNDEPISTPWQSKNNSLTLH